MITTIISGGQTGVDRAALDVALSLGLPCGGWCPRGRKAEDGIIDARYPLQETPWNGYPQRTEWNVRDSDGTLIITCGPADRGTTLTQTLTQRLGKSCFILDLSDEADPDTVLQWAVANHVMVLNVAGHRESSSPGIGSLAATFLHALLPSIGERRHIPR